MGVGQTNLTSGSWTKRPSLVALLSVGFGLLPVFSQAQPAGGLFTPQTSFHLTNHLVSVSVFQWFAATGGQLSGPWGPVEGRSNWTGTTDFWRAQIMQMMAANFDVLYVHLIPSSEEERVNLFQALNQLRREGWNVPKVAPFLDPMITWYQQPLVDVNTPAGKDTFADQYIRWFNQYYSVNQDPYADDHLARINGRPVLDTWHVQFNLTNLTALTRADVETRLQSAFAARHPLFTNGIYMVTTALNDPTFSWTDEKVPQFEINEYYYAKVWGSLRTVQLKGGYWDQNIRNPGSFLPRNGGLPYRNAWSRVNRSQLSRVYVESWNEYDEGTGIYAANPGPPYLQPDSGNLNTDVWSSANDPYEYIKTTARGAAAFNDWPERDAKILWHNLPTRMSPGETRTATVIVRNEGDALWSEAAQYRFGQKEFLDPVLFGAGRYLIDDTQDDIPTYGGIFRGRPTIFTLSVQAPTTPGRYTNHWSMLQENVTWFGQELAHETLVDPTLIYHGQMQSIDSTVLLTNNVNDSTEHTYVAANLAVGSHADCRITRAFAAPIKSINVAIVSGTADDVGYVGNILVTPDSANQTCQLGHVTNEVDVTGAVSVNGNTASLTLRARDTCCCATGWGEDTASDRLNAKLRWEVQLSPPVPFSLVFTNPAQGHFYALLSPATWTWSERAATALGGHLATIRSQAEQDRVYTLLASYGGVNRLLWIGLNDVAAEGRFVWSSGEPVNFTYWAPTEPNNALTGEDFVTLYQPGHPQAGRWNDWGERVFDGSRPFNGVLELVAPMGPPNITAQPQGRRLNPDAPFDLSVGALGSPTLQYQWRFNGSDIPGATSSAYTLSGAQYADAGNYSVRVMNALGSVESSNALLIVNHAPVAKIVVAPFVKVPGITNLLVIAPPCTNTTVVLDGSSSSDVEDDSLQYFWFLGAHTNASATGVVAMVTLPVGTNAVALIVSDGAATATASAAIEVITAWQAVERLLVAPVHDSSLPRGDRLLLNVASLAAEAALQRGHLVGAIEWLELFQHQVRARVAPRDAALAEKFLAGARAIIGVLRDCVTHGKPRCTWGRLACQADGTVRMHFSAPRGPVYLIEASTDLVRWETIGAARDCGTGEFEFEDTRAAPLPQRFYRIVAP